MRRLASDASDPVLRDGFMRLADLYEARASVGDSPPSMAPPADFGD
jgi:hypothetical protein